MFTTENKPVRGNRLAACIAAALAAACLLLGSGNLLVARALEAAHTHTVNLQQREVAQLYHAVQAAPPQPDYAALSAHEGPAGPNGETPNPSAGALQAAWLQTQLQGKVLLQTIPQPDGCAVFLALDTVRRELSLYALNQCGEPHTVALNLENRGQPITAVAETYALQHVQASSSEILPGESGSGAIAPPLPGEPGVAETAAFVQAPLPSLLQALGQTAAAAGLSHPPPQNRQAETQGETWGGQPAENPVGEPAGQEPGQPATAQSSSASASLSLAGSAPAASSAPGAAPDSAGVPQSSSFAQVPPVQNAHSAAEEQTLAQSASQEGAPPVESTQDAPPEEALKATGQELVANESHALETVEGAVPLTVPPGGAGCITLQTGVLYGGPLAAQNEDDKSKAFTALEELTLSSGPAVAAAGQHGLLRLYSGADLYPGTEQPARGYATYSADNHLFAYDFDETTDIVPGASVANGTYFTVELHNSLPVRLRSINAGAQPATATQTIAAAVPGAVLLLQNDAGPALNYAGKLVLTGTGRLEVTSGSGVAVASTRQATGGNVQLKNGFSAAASGQAGGMQAWCLSLTGRSELRARATDGASVAVAVAQETYVAQQSLLYAEGGAKGLESDTLFVLDDAAADASFATLLDIPPQGTGTRSIVCGLGGHTGVATGANNGLYTGKGGLVAGQGGVYGIATGGLQTGTAVQNTGTGRPALAGGVANKAGGTVIGTTDAGGKAGVFFDMHVAGYLDDGVRVVAVGGQYGLEYAAHVASNFYIRHQSQLIAFGADAGLYTHSATAFPIINDVHQYYGSKVYARGGNYGARLAYGCWYSARPGYPGSSTSETAGWALGPPVTVAIGGVDDAQMELSPLVNAAAWATTAFAFEELPVPQTVHSSESVTDPTTGQSTPLERDLGYLPAYKPGTYGIRTDAYGFVAAYDKDTVIDAYGGDTGVSSATSYVVSYHGANMQAHGGHTGARSGSYIHCWSQDPNSVVGPNDNGNSILKGYGKTYGLYSSSYLDTTGTFAVGRYGQSYVYGYGERNGIFATTWMQTHTGSTIVAETVVDEAAAPADDRAQPAIHTGGKIRMYTEPGTPNGLVHEVYNVVGFHINWVGANPINTSIPPVGSAMGTNPATLLQMNWTTPRNLTITSPDGRDWKQYDPADDAGLVTAGTQDGAIGLLSAGSPYKVALVGTSRTTVHNMVRPGGSYTGAVNSKFNNSEITGNGVYRVTLREADTALPKTMNVKLRFWARGQAGDTPLTSALGTAVFTLDYQPPGESAQTRTISADDLLDTSTGTIQLTKLRPGSYTLRAATGPGGAYLPLPPVRFIVKNNPDVSAALDDGTPGGAGEAHTGDGKLYARVAVASAAITDESGKGAMTMPEPNPAYDIEARHASELDVYYYEQESPGTSSSSHSASSSAVSSSAPASSPSSAPFTSSVASSNPVSSQPAGSSSSTPPASISPLPVSSSAAAPPAPSASSFAASSAPFARSVSQQVPTAPQPPTPAGVEPPEAEEEGFWKLPSNTKLFPGDSVDYTMSGFGNDFGTKLEKYSISDILPEGLLFQSASLPAFSGSEGITYDVVCTTNLSSGKTLHSNVPAGSAFTVPAPTLQSGEYITSITFEFGTVPDGFGMGNAIVFTCVLDANPPTSVLVNRGLLFYHLNGKAGSLEAGNRGLEIGGPPATGDAYPIAWGVLLLLTAHLMLCATILLRRRWLRS